MTPLFPTLNTISHNITRFPGLSLSSIAPTMQLILALGLFHLTPANIILLQVSNGYGKILKPYYGTLGTMSCCHILCIKEHSLSLLFILNLLLTNYHPVSTDDLQFCMLIYLITLLIYLITLRVGHYSTH